MSGHTIDALPDWPTSTASVLATVGPDGEPHAIPVSTARRAGPKRIVFALGPTRGTHTRLRADGRAALLVMANDVAFTAEGTIRFIAEPLSEEAGVDGLELLVDTIWDHNGPTFGMDEGVRWHWTQDDAEHGDNVALEALERLC